MENIKDISLVAFLYGGKKVDNKRDASLVKYLTNDGYLILPKKSMTEKKWEQLPETVS